MIETILDAVAPVVEPVRTAFVAQVLLTLGTPVEPLVDAITLPVQTPVDAVAAGVESSLDPVAAISRRRRIYVPRVCTD